MNLNKQGARGLNLMQTVARTLSTQSVNNILNATKCQYWCSMVLHKFSFNWAKLNPTKWICFYSRILKWSLNHRDFYTLCLRCCHMTHTNTHTHTRVYVYFFHLTILIYLRTKSKVNSHPQIPADPRATLEQRKGDLRTRRNCLYSVAQCVPTPLKIRDQLHL